MARLPLVPGAGIPSCLLLLAALSSAGFTNGASKGELTKTGNKFDMKETVALTATKDLAEQESKKVQSTSPNKRQIRKFDFDAEFATYLGLASQADTARFLAGDADSSYKAPAALHETHDGELYPPLRLAPGSTPASVAYFTHIYPNEHADGDIRIEHFSPVIHPTSAERERKRLREESDGPEPYVRAKSNYYPSDANLYAPPTSRSYFGRYSNKQRYGESSEDGDKYGPKSSKLHSSNPLSHSTGFDDDSTPDFKIGYRHVGMYHKFHEEDLHPKKTSSEWIPSKLTSKHKHEANRDGNYNDPGSYHDAQVSAEDFPVKSEHDDEISRIKNNIDNDSPYSTSNFDLAEKNFASVGKFKTKGTAFKGADDYDAGHSSSESSADSPFKSEQRPQKHKRRRKKKKHHHHHKRPQYRTSPADEASVPFSNQGRGSEYKAPSFEFRNPVNTYVSPPYTPPETHKSNLKTEPYKSHEFDSSKENFKLSSGPSAPSEPFRTGSGEGVTLTREPDKDVSFEEPPETPAEPADIDYGPGKLDDFDDDYPVSESGPAEFSEDFAKGQPDDGKLYGSFETFDSQLDPATNKKFEPFVQFPFDEQRKKLASVVKELIETGESSRKK